MEFPKHLNLDLTKRASRMLSAGNVVVTVKSKSTGEHITVKLASRLKNDSGRGKKWQPVGPDQASHIFASVRSADAAGWDDKIGTYYPRNGRFYEDDKADPARVWAASAVMQWLCGNADETRAIYQESSECGRCGKKLTDPVSIERGIGPECWGKVTGSQHQVKDKTASSRPTEDEVIARDARNAEEEHAEAHMFDRQTRGDEAAKREALAESSVFTDDNDGIFS
jgi:hypothetical protein